MTGLGKQAKLLTDAQTKIALRYVASPETGRYPLRDRAMLLLSFRAGLRAKEISQATWSMVTDSEGALVDVLSLTNAASKGKRGGREIPIAADLFDALRELHAKRKAIAAELVGPSWPVVHSERGKGMSANGVTMWFYRLYKTLGMVGASSHSGRRTFVTKAARKISEAGGSLRDVQELAGHASLQTTQRYIEGSSEAKRKLIDILR